VFGFVLFIFLAVDLSVFIGVSSAAFALLGKFKFSVRVVSIHSTNVLLLAIRTPVPPLCAVVPLHPAMFGTKTLIMPRH